MIELKRYDIGPPGEAVKTEKVERPQPETNEVDIWEMNTVLPKFDKGILFSGGDDSLALTHLAMEEGWADIVVHLDTRTGVHENIDYVRNICEEYGWPLIILSTPMDFEIFSMRYGFPGPNCHTQAYHTLKGRQLQHLNKRGEGSLKLVSGVRMKESDRRKYSIEGEIQYAEPGTDNFRGWWWNPIYEKSDEWVENYREEHSLPRNPVAKKIHRSGDCMCLAFGHRDEELVMLEAEYPETANWLLNIEKRVQEYRGRVELLREKHPKILEKVEDKRQETQPYPMRLTVLKQSHPEVYQSIVDVDKEDAINRGKTEKTNYLGHGGLSSKELRTLLNRADKCQQTLCEHCGGRSESVSRSVREQVEEAEKKVETYQEKLI